ncbi:MAG TPA: hypothetical protein VIN03_28305 [Roseateles sp.]
MIRVLKNLNVTVLTQCCVPKSVNAMSNRISYDPVKGEAAGGGWRKRPSLRIARARQREGLMDHASWIRVLGLVATQLRVHG